MNLIPHSTLPRPDKPQCGACGDQLTRELNHCLKQYDLLTGDVLRASEVIREAFREKQGLAGQLEGKKGFLK